MSFPLGNFSPSLAVKPAVLEFAKEQVMHLHRFPWKPGDITRGYYHWTVAGMDGVFPDYNYTITEHGGAYAMTPSHRIQDNALSTFSSDYAAHTYHRNKGAVGIALAGMDGATPQNFGKDPVTVAGLETLCAAMAAVAVVFDIDALGRSVGGSYANEPNFMTHAEAADRPGAPAQYDAYGPLSTSERWDLAALVPVPEGQAITAAVIKASGDALRAVTHSYVLALRKG